MLNEMIQRESGPLPAQIPHLQDLCILRASVVMQFPG